MELTKRIKAAQIALYGFYPKENLGVKQKSNLSRV